MYYRLVCTLQMITSEMACLPWTRQKCLLLKPWRWIFAQITGMVSCCACMDQENPGAWTKQCQESLLLLIECHSYSTMLSQVKQLKPTSVDATQTRGFHVLPWQVAMLLSEPTLGIALQYQPALAVAILAVCCLVLRADSACTHPWLCMCSACRTSGSHAFLRFFPLELKLWGRPAS